MKKLSISKKRVKNITFTTVKKGKADLKKMLADAFGIGETLKSGNLISWVVFGLTFLISLAFFILIL